MKERRSLTEGIKSATVDPNVEKGFVFGDKAEPPKAPAPKATEIREQNGQPPLRRVPLTTRVRADFATALKRESLHRQLESRFPNSLQEVLEEALEPWMRDKGYLE